METNDKQINQMQLDLLGELGNIGSGNAATALSQILNKTVYLDVPNVELCNISEVGKSFGDPELKKTAVFFQTQQDVKGYVLLVFEDEDVKKISKIAAGGMEIDADSVMTEIGNIVAGSYIGALASMVEGKIDLTPPQIAHDMLGSLIDNIVSLICVVADELVIIKTKMTIGNETIPSFFILFLEDESLKKLLDYFNFEK